MILAQGDLVTLITLGCKVIKLSRSEAKTAAMETTVTRFVEAR